MKDTFAYKFGDVPAGRWSWAVGAADPIRGRERPIQIAVINTHGALAAEADPERVAALYAEAPAMLAALRDAIRWVGKGVADGAYSECVAPHAADACLAKMHAILARIDGGAA